MCQMSVVMEKKEQKEKIIEEVTKIEITDKGIIISTFFDDPKIIENAVIKEIDCLESTVTLLSKG